MLKIFRMESWNVGGMEKWQLYSGDFSPAKAGFEMTGGRDEVWGMELFVMINCYCFIL